MKLRNKKNGYIISKYTIRALEGIDADKGVQTVYIRDDESKKTWTYFSLAGFNEDWEDYEEPTTFWYIDNYDTMLGEVDKTSDPDCGIYTDRQVERFKEIGNHFETEEETKQALEKLKALERLREKGFKFDGWSWYPSSIRGMEIISIKANMDIQTDFENKKSYLDLLFGGEE